MVLDGILKAFGLRRNGGDKRAERAALLAETKPAATPAADPDAFRRGLAAIVRESGTAATGHIQFLGLNGIRERLGDRWERLTKRIHTTTRQCIKAHVSASDLFIQYNDMTYLLAFSGGDESEAVLKCALIAKAINEALFGEDGIESVQIQSIVSVVDEDLVLETVSLQSCLDKVAANAKSSGTLVPAPPAADPANGQASAAAPVAGRAGTTDASISSSAAPSPRPATPVPPTAHTQPVAAKALNQPPNHAADAPMPAEQSARPLPAGPTARAGPVLPPESVDQLSFVYVPIWNAKAEAISAYHCVPTRETPDGPLFGYAAIYGTRSKIQPVEVDILALRHSIELMTQLMANSFEYIAVHSVHFDTLTDPMQRRAYLASCHCIPPDLTQYQTIEIFGAPAGVPTSRYIEIISMLKPFFKKTYLRTSLRGEHLPSANDAGFDGFSLPVQDTPKTVDEKLALLVQTNRKIKRLGRESYAYDARSHQTFLGAADAEYDWIGGHMVLKPVKIPSHVVRHPRSNFEPG